MQNKLIAIMLEAESVLLRARKVIDANGYAHKDVWLQPDINAAIEELREAQKHLDDEVTK